MTSVRAQADIACRAMLSTSLYVVGPATRVRR
jgi:hypothetical protein